VIDPIDVRSRRAEPDDVEALVRMYSRALEAHNRHRGGELDGLLQARANSKDLNESYRAEIGSSGVYVATVDEHVLGYVVSRVGELISEELLMTVEEIYVEPEARGVGLGTALLNCVVADADASGCRGIDARALPGDRSTKNFFESFGLVARAILVHKIALAARCAAYSDTSSVSLSTGSGSATIAGSTTGSLGAGSATSSGSTEGSLGAGVATGLGLGLGLGLNSFAMSGTR